MEWNGGQTEWRNSDSNEVGTLCKMLIKTEYNDLQVLFNLYSIEYTTKTRYVMLNWQTL